MAAHEGRILLQSGTVQGQTIPKKNKHQESKEREGPDLTFLDLAAHKGRRSLFQNGTVSRKTIPEWNKHQQSN